MTRTEEENHQELQAAPVEPAENEADSIVSIESKEEEEEMEATHDLDEDQQTQTVHSNAPNASANNNKDQRNNLEVNVTTPISSPVEKQPETEETVQYVDEKTKAMGRKAELEELRKKKDVTSKKGE